MDGGQALDVVRVWLEPGVTAPSVKLSAVAASHSLQGAALRGPLPDPPLPHHGFPEAAVQPARSLR